jgi:MFS family permease
MYINSSFLAEFMPESQVGFLFAAASALGVIALGAATVFLNRFGNYNTALVAAALDFAAVVGLATLSEPGLLVVCFAVHFLLVAVLMFTLDIFLENKTTDEGNTGNVRGIFLSMATLAAMLAPVIAGYLAGDANRYEFVYIASAAYLVPFIIILMRHFHGFVDPHYPTLAPVRTFIKLLRDGNVFHIAVGQFLMRFYFAWMVVYLPIYLHGTIGFTWPEIGMILFIMLMPYVLLEWPAGMLADSWLGEKELLAAGFIITAVSTGILYVLAVPSIALWAAVLFVTRVGTALIESMTETYFFKHVDGDDTDMIGVFRMLRPLAYMVGPLAATLLLYFVSLQILWLILAFVMLYGLVHVWAIVDTR